MTDVGHTGDKTKSKVNEFHWNGKQTGPKQRDSITDTTAGDLIQRCDDVQEVRGVWEGGGGVWLELL